MKEIVVLGSTGSIGRNCLAVAREFSSAFRIVGLATGSNVDALAEQVEEFRPEVVSIAQEAAAEEFSKRHAASGLRVLSGTEGLRELARWKRSQMIVNGLVGAIGLVPTVEAIEAGKDVALANKESMVLAGELVMSLARARGSTVLPIDSEHCGIHQCLVGRSAGIRRIVLTASGGPFLNREPDELRDVTPEEVMQHPVWNMGRRICVDSATLLNKGFELMEARWFFGVELSSLGVLIHPQCAIHAMVEFADGTALAQVSRADMRIPILYAMSYPETVDTRFESSDLPCVGPLTFAEPDLERFPCLRLAYSAARAGGTVPAFLNAADEVAVAAFLERRIRFTDIIRVLEGSLERLAGTPATSVEGVLRADGEARIVAREIVTGIAASS
ncbi:MAG: 1-deoxy-D-xylulose-5-phosphate reductoisomerase [Candidatus Eisenbacteria bacterium]|nr:1-deoxy-D-xylulose-5-phosphate reductoisomerase [Candidatus Eisenbacteria bacterium]